MQLNPYGEDAVLLAVRLLNDPPTSPQTLTESCLDAGLVIDRAITSYDVRRVRSFLGRWSGVVDAATPADRVRRANELLAEFSAHPRLTDHAGTGWHIHYRELELPIWRVVAALISVGTALHLAGRGMQRLGRCAAEPCRNAFADVSRTGRQRYCSTTCANRDAVRRHRRRVG